jgi:hypothetical protein
MPWVQPAGADGTESGCAPSAANLERIAAVVVTVITVLTAITAAAKIRQGGAGE